MDLKSGILRVARFASKEKDGSPEASQNIRFLPGLKPGDCARLCCTNGLMGSIVTLDSDVEVLNAALGAVECAQMARASGYVARMEWKGKGVEFTTRRDKGVETYKFLTPAKNILTFPAIPTVPEPLTFVRNWKDVLAVAHAASGPKVDNPIFRCVRFLEKSVEATDRYRVARANVEAGYSGLVPKELFAGWPPGDVFMRITALLAFFRIETSEVRFSSIMHGAFTDTRQVVPEEHRGLSGIIPVTPFCSAVKQAAKATKTKVVLLDFQKDTVRVESWQAKPDQLFSTVVGADGAEPGRVLVNGGNLVEALSKVRTPRVFVGYGPTEKDLLRLESGRLVLCLWPMLETEKEKANESSKS